MADALCGPSNALQNFQKHTSVDRTLQQDRLAQRQSPSQGFRSSPGPNAGLLDAEFEAFQTGFPGPPQPDFHQFAPQFSHPPPRAQFAQAPQAPDWASDFQQLNISPLQAPPIQRHHPAQASNASWHQDFARHQAPAVQSPAQTQSPFGGMSRYGMGGPMSSYQGGQTFGYMNGTPVSAVAQGKQRSQEGVPQFDEAAFERAFAQAQDDMLEELSVPDQGASNEVLERIMRAEQQEETDPVLIRLREKRLPVYHVLKLRSELDTGHHETAAVYLQHLDALEKDGTLVKDASEAKWCIDALQKIADREDSGVAGGQAEKLIKAINQRLMSTYPLLATPVPINQDMIWEDIVNAGYTTDSLRPEQVAQPQPQEQQKEEQPFHNDEDDMAATAGQLLERVAGNTSEKFQNSQFLGLMRRLRDREVRVEGDKMVEVSAQSSSSPLPATSTVGAATPIPEIDLHILDHAATDFDMPMDSETEFPYEGLDLRRVPSNDPLTDEVSEQFRNYNVNGAYHR
ncbi:hypothetical protein P154DRAFT_100626 [Amniculicola lignicola CBS 123094]|uniref:Uncharacterized protein n=1 Tax=Amniculicola lignicola CBS 123094 TaxID=1392246 RepID=A0A6A5WR32_9PLEO|nr:hypothetical protein P154DRAFT_100626 [Amniculicola lignicola CBS 123094]